MHLYGISQNPVAASIPAESMITWRPAACIDAYLIPDRTNTHYVIAIATTPSHESLTLFSSTATLPVVVPALVFCAHITVDQLKDSGVMVMLIYDSFSVDGSKRRMASNVDDTCKARYRKVQETFTHWTNPRLGEAVISVQWSGEREAYNDLKNLNLPHKVGHIVTLGQDMRYQRVEMVPV